MGRSNVSLFQNVNIIIHIKILSENKLMICAIGNIHYQISREKFEPELGLELEPPDL